MKAPPYPRMTKTRIQFGRRFDHFVGNGTTEHYAPGDVGEFDHKLANALVYEGYAVPADELDQKSEGDAPEDKALDAAPENKSRKKK